MSQYRLHYGLPWWSRWDEFLKNSTPPAREEILNYARKTELIHRGALATSYFCAAIGWLTFIFSKSNHFGQIAGMGVAIIGFTAICMIYVCSQMWFTELRRMWEQCEDREAELRKSIAEDL